MAIVIRIKRKLTKRKILRQRLIYYLKLQNICAKTEVTKNVRSQCRIRKTLNVLRKIANLKLYSKITFFKKNEALEGDIMKLMM